MVLSRRHPLGRLRGEAGACYIVDIRGRVYKALGRPTLGRADELGGDEAATVLESVRQTLRWFDFVPGNRTADGRYEVRGVLTRPEVRAFEAGGQVAADRRALLLHLDFFDRDLDGRITLAESYRGWRALGFPIAASVFKALASALVFGTWASLRTVIAVDEVTRFDGRTGIYDASGALDRERLQRYLAAFDVAGGRLSVAGTEQLLDAQSTLGDISRRQFASFFEVCLRLNGGEPVVTAAQFRGLFDGSLLWLAGSMPDKRGRRPG